VGRNQLVVGVSVPLPVFDSNRGNQLQALRLADQAEEQLLATHRAAADIDRLLGSESGL
jgi:cobalt-zinc-cadmium efflux system outer membrane protein